MLLYLVHRSGLRMFSEAKEQYSKREKTNGKAASLSCCFQWSHILFYRPGAKTVLWLSRDDCTASPVPRLSQLSGCHKAKCPFSPSTGTESAAKVACFLRGLHLYSSESWKPEWEMEGRKGWGRKWRGMERSRAVPERWEAVVERNEDWKEVILRSERYWETGLQNT